MAASFAIVVMLAFLSNSHGFGPAFAVALRHIGSGADPAVISTSPGPAAARLAKS
jgi:hypothetical protein